MFGVSLDQLASRRNAGVVDGHRETLREGALHHIPRHLSSSVRRG
jgi:hypothetical protein